MQSCEGCQILLLEYLYDLLDEGDRLPLRAHLDGCAACQAALAKVQQQQNLFAAAAKMEFPGVRFVEPPAEPVPAPRLAQPAPMVPWRRRAAAAAAWLGGVGATQWAASAAVMALLFVLVGSGVWFGSDYAVARAAVDRHDAEVAQLTKQVQDADTGRRQLAFDADAKKAGILDEFRRKELLVSVTGPATVEPGAKAAYIINTTDFKRTPTDAKVSVQVMNGAQPVSEPIQAIASKTGEYEVSLPADLPVPRGSHLAVVVNAQREHGQKAGIRADLQLAAAPVYLTHLTTDKPVYLPGEVVHFRSLTLERATLRPAQEDLCFHFELATPMGEKKEILTAPNGIVLADAEQLKTADGADLKLQRGLSAGEFALDKQQRGGEYTLMLREEQNRFPAQERKFLVNNYQKPQLNKELDFSRKTYGVGDEVIARCKVTDTKNAPLSHKPVEATVQIDGKTYDAKGKDSKDRLTLATDDNGVANVRFKLPGTIDRGLASLTVTFNDGANTESLVRPIPLVLNKLNVEFFPEGGDLVAGLQNRVYFQVRTLLDKPADLKGRLLEDGTPLAVELQTLNDVKEPGANQGMGVFGFTPKAGHKYKVQVDSPAGIKDHFPLPDVKDDGVVLTIDRSVVGAGKPIQVQVQSSPPRSLLVGAYCRGQLLNTVQLDKGQTEATLQPAVSAGGVCRVTVFEKLDGQGDGRRDVKPVAERLIYRDPAEKVSLAIHPDQSSYLPGQKAKLTVQAVTENDEAAVAVLMLRVVDKRVETLADEKTARSMPTHFLLTSEVRRPEDLEYADFLLGPQEKARQALDLLLGTQGWRRFAEQDPIKFRKENNDTNPVEAERLVYSIGQSQPVVTDLVQQEIGRTEQVYRDEAQKLEETKSRTEEKRRAAATDTGYVAALARLARYRGFFDDVSRWIFPGLGVLVGVILVVSVVLGLKRGSRRAVPYFTAAAVSAAVLLVGGAVYLSHLPNQQAAALPERGGEQQVAQAAAAAGPFLGELEDKATGARFKAVEEKVDGKDEAKKVQLEEGKAQAMGGLNLAKDAKPEIPAITAPAGAKENFPQGAPAPAPAAAPRAPPPGETKGAAAEGDKADQYAFRNLGRQRAEQMAKQKNLEGLKEVDAVRRDMEELQKRERGFMLPEQADRRGPGGPPPAVAGGRVGGFGGGMVGGGGFPDGIAQKPGGGKGGGGGNFGQPFVPPPPPVVVREYTHQHSLATGSGLPRADFTETVYWHPALVLPNGKREVSFDLADSVTTYQVTAFAHTLNGRVGSATQTFDARLPFTLEPKVPIEVTSSDMIDVPLSIANNGAGKEKVNVKISGKDGLELLSGAADATFDVDAGAPLRKVYRFRPSVAEGQAALTFAGKAGAFADATRNQFTIVPEGFPIVGSVSDMLEGSATQTVTLPDAWVKGTLKVQANVYPSTLADLQKGLDGLLREPNGCFEQTSTTNYPNLLILDYLKQSDQANPAVERRARDLLARGYQKLTSFECMNSTKQAKEGYEWFGGAAPAHEALTAYGLMQFRDMARVQDVDAQMLQRTKQYLLAQRDGKGGFKRNPRALDTFGRAPDDVTNAYIVWALTESGKDDDVATELTALHKQAQTSKDSYFLSLVAASLLNRDRREDAVQLLKKVAAAQKDDGHLDAERTSITGSGGRDLQIETTALAVLGFLKANQPAVFNVPVQKAIKWIGQQRGGYGGFGSTQSTILALKALIAYARENKKTAAPGELKLYVGNREVSKLAFPAGTSEALTLSVRDAEKELKPGANKVRVEVTGKNAFPYTLTWTYSTLQPTSAANCPVRLTTKLATTAIKEGDSVRLTVAVENKSGKGQGMAVAVVGLPGGLTLPEDLKQLKEYTAKPANGDRPLVSAFEIRGRELILYWRDLAPEQKIEVPVDLIGRVPGEYSGPASRAYLYYNADLKHWVEPLKMAIAAKE